MSGRRRGGGGLLARADCLLVVQAQFAGHSGLESIGVAKAEVVAQLVHLGVVVNESIDVINTEPIKQLNKQTNMRTNAIEDSEQQNSFSVRVQSCIPNTRVINNHTSRNRHFSYFCRIAFILVYVVFSFLFSLPLSLSLSIS